MNREKRRASQRRAQRRYRQTYKGRMTDMRAYTNRRKKEMA